MPLTSPVSNYFTHGNYFLKNELPFAGQPIVMMLSILSGTVARCIAAMD